MLKSRNVVCWLGVLLVGATAQLAVGKEKELKLKDFGWGKHVGGLEVKDHRSLKDKMVLLIVWGDR